MTRCDDQFTISGETFRRSWTGDRYDWTSRDGRLVCWCSKRYFDVDRCGVKRQVHEYNAKLDGYPSTRSWPTLTAAMVASVISRDAYDKRRAAA